MSSVLERTDRAAPSTLANPAIALPAEIERVFRDYRCAEVATLAKDGTPLAWPLIVLYRPERGCFITTTSIGLPQKAYNVRRDGRVSLLYSDPTGSGLDGSPAVLVQGDAIVSREVVTWDDDLRDLWQLLAVRQPSSSFYSKTALTRWLMAFYYQRLMITIVPRRVSYWADGDCTRPAREIEVRHVG